MTMLRARCRECDWIWDVVALPMPIEKAAQVIGGARCPMCGNGDDNTVAEGSPLTDTESDHKRRLNRIPLPPEDDKCHG